MPGGSRGEARAAGWSDGPLVGRDHLLDELTAAAHAAARGEGSVVLLTGEAGIGKTTVARAVAQRVREQLAISWGACSPDNTAPPFWPWRALVAVSSSERGDDAEQAVGAPRYEQLSALRAELLGAVAAQPRV
ncbi:MAG: AAA family ATPase, partial [Actinobacteria bacterium]|nr:AAA family ATPase [Actinomycetota bacterium]MBV9933597.1 AAA family ATPase [Actinomycetota bacterium]